MKNEKQQPQNNHRWIFVTFQKTTPLWNDAMLCIVYIFYHMCTAEIINSTAY